MDADKRGILSTFICVHLRLKLLLPHQGKARPPDGFVLADGAAGRGGEALPLLEGKAAVFADRRGYLEAATRPRGAGNVGQVVQDLLFRLGEALGQLQAGEDFFQQQLLDHLAQGIHQKNIPPMPRSYRKQETEA